MKEKTIQTLHPQEGKKNKVISLEKYEAIKDGILKALRNKELTHTQLLEQVAANPENKLNGNINWYTETVKLDLEARQMIERTNEKPQTYRLKNK